MTSREVAKQEAQTSAGRPMALSAEVLEDLKTVFTKLDRDKSGKICAPELLAVLQQFQKSAHLADAEKLIAEVDDDGSGDIDWQEFCKILQSTVANRPTAATMFDQLDTAGVGELTPSVIRAGMVRYEMEHITDQDVDQMIRAIDENNDGMVGLSEFNTALARR